MPCPSPYRYPSETIHTERIDVGQVEESVSKSLKVFIEFLCHKELNPLFNSGHRCQLAVLRCLLFMHMHVRACMDLQTSSSIHDRTSALLCI